MSSLFMLAIFLLGIAIGLSNSNETGKYFALETAMMVGCMVLLVLDWIVCYQKGESYALYFNRNINWCMS